MNRAIFTILLFTLFTPALLCGDTDSLSYNSQVLEEKPISLDSLIVLNDQAIMLKNSGALSQAKKLYPVILNGIVRELGTANQAYLDVSVNYTRLLNELGDIRSSEKIFGQLDSIIQSGAFDIDFEGLHLLNYSRAEAQLYLGNYESALVEFKKIEKAYKRENRTNDIIYSNTLNGIAECYELSKNYTQSKKYFEMSLSQDINSRSKNQIINLRNNYLEMAIKADSLDLGRQIWQNINLDLNDSINDVIEYIAYFNYLKLCEKAGYDIEEDRVLKALTCYEAVTDEILNDLNERQLISFARRKFKNFQEVLRVLKGSKNQKVLQQLYRCHRKSKDIVNRYYLSDFTKGGNETYLTSDTNVPQLDFFEYILPDSIIQYGFFQESQNSINLHTIDYTHTIDSGFSNNEFYPYWESLTASLDEYDQVLISPVGQLHQFNFQIYTKKSNTQYLITKHIKGEGSSDVNEILVIGGLYYDSEDQELYSDQIVSRSENFQYLPYSKKEVDFLQEFIEANGFAQHSLTGEDATEETFNNLIHQSSYNIIHFSTHGFFNDLEDAQDDYNSGFYKSGLVLSKPVFENSSKSDNVLYGNEVLALDCSGVDLVFMSSCQSGISDVTHGDNLYGIQSAFQRAGVNNIISTSDVVFDNVSFAFAKSFYSNLMEGQTYYGAYKSALLAIFDMFGLEEASKFKFIGDGQARVKSAKASSLMFSILAIFLVIVVYFFLKRTLRSE